MGAPIRERRSFRCGNGTTGALKRRQHSPSSKSSSCTVPVARRTLLLMMLGSLGACVTSTEGDFGRAERSPANESIMKFGGKWRAKLQGELYSDFNMTDEEILMRDKAWALIRPPHAQDWVSTELWDFIPSIRYATLHVLTDLQRTRLTPVIDTAFNAKHYYRALRAEKYASHHVRYDRITADINADREVFAAFIPVAERVVAMDGERMSALNRASDMEPGELKNAYARVDENRRFVGWVWRAMKFRMQAYAYAIKRLEIETPSPKVADANAALRRLHADFLAQSGDFGQEGFTIDDTTERPSRYTRRQWAQEDPNMVK